MRTRRCVPPALPAPPPGRTVVVRAGKAAAAMARAVESCWVGELTGTVVTAYGHAVECARIEVLESAHPVPEDAGRRAAERLFERVRGLGADDLVLCLISGGGSALLPFPAEGLSLDDKQAITRALLRSGATIREINTVRRYLSRIKGGRLGVACHPARVVTLAISDGPGDDPVDIAPGPTVADPTTCAEARRSQVGSGERAEKIRTYNSPQSRITHHRINLSSYNMPAVLDGDIDVFIDELATRSESERLAAVGVEE